ncbi:hypothetical protein [Microbacterium gilvum]
MKKSAWITAATAAVVVAGGVGAYALTSQDEPAPVETVAVETTAPTVEPTPTTEPTGTPTPTVEPTPEPTPEATYSESESAYLAAADESLRGWQIVKTDQELMEAGWYVCEDLANGGHVNTTTPLAEGGTVANSNLARIADEYLC